MAETKHALKENLFTASIVYSTMHSKSTLIIMNLNKWHCYNMSLQAKGIWSVWGLDHIHKI